MAQEVNPAELDAYLAQVVQALHRTVKYAIPHAKEPQIADKAVQDCKEILDITMEGKVSEWLR